MQWIGASTEHQEKGPLLPVPFLLVLSVKVLGQGSGSPYWNLGSWNWRFPTHRQKHHASMKLKLQSFMGDWVTHSRHYPAESNKAQRGNEDNSSSPKANTQFPWNTLLALNRQTQIQIQIWFTAAGPEREKLTVKRDWGVSPRSLSYSKDKSPCEVRHQSAGLLFHIISSSYRVPSPNNRDHSSSTYLLSFIDCSKFYTTTTWSR